MSDEPTRRPSSFHKLICRKAIFLKGCDVMVCIDSSGHRSMSHLSGGHAKSERRPPDPAEQGWLRWYYRNWRPTLLGRISNSIWAWLTSLGLLPPVLLTLQVADRRDGRMRSTVLAVVEHERNRYLVSMLGDTSEWVKNIRAAGGRAFIKRGSAIEVRLTEIPNEDRAPILRAWCQIATSGRRHLPVPYDAPVEAFEALSLDYPVFRIDPAPMPVADSRKQ